MPTLTEAEKLDIVKVLTTPGQIVTYVDVNDKIFNLGDNYITAAVETDIRALLTEWLTVRDSNESIEPMERNFGVRLNSESQKNRIRTELASLLYMTELNFGGSNWAYNKRA